MLVKAEELNELAKIDGGKFKVENIEDAFEFCKKISCGHYENFPVGSILIPTAIQKHFFSIYSFARIADDIGDELTKIQTSDFALSCLEKYNNCLEIIYSKDFEVKNVSNPIFLALHSTIKEFNIPINPFKRLLAAFQRDILFQEFEDFSSILEYCSNSANPIGELLLHIYNEINNINLSLSDKICSGLQLINFWQDISIDASRGRSYIPIQLKDISSKEILLENLYSFTKNLMYDGKSLVKNIKNLRFKIEIAFIISSGNRMLKKIEQIGTDIFSKRPELQKLDLFPIVFNAFKILIIN